MVKVGSNMNHLKYIFICSFLFFSSITKSDELKNFLLTCAYGTAAGAGLGMATVAFAEDPSSKTSNIAKGASLGLYAGIAVGWYVNYGPSKQRMEAKNSIINDRLFSIQLDSKAEENLNTIPKNTKAWTPYVVFENKKTEIGSILFF